MQRGAAGHRAPFIARGKVTAHRAAMVAAFVTSSLFLVSYLYYHWPGHGGIVYFRGRDGCGLST